MEDIFEITSIEESYELFRTEKKYPINDRYIMEFCNDIAKKINTHYSEYLSGKMFVTNCCKIEYIIDKKVSQLLDFIENFFDNNCAKEFIFKKVYYTTYHVPTDYNPEKHEEIHRLVIEFEFVKPIGIIMDELRELFKIESLQHIKNRIYNSLSTYYDNIERFLERNECTYRLELYIPPCIEDTHKEFIENCLKNEAKYKYMYIKNIDFTNHRNKKNVYDAVLYIITLGLIESEENLQKIKELNEIKKQKHIKEIKDRVNRVIKTPMIALNRLQCSSCEINYSNVKDFIIAKEYISTMWIVNDPSIEIIYTQNNNESNDPNVHFYSSIQFKLKIKNLWGM